MSPLLLTFLPLAPAYHAGPIAPACSWSFMYIFFSGNKSTLQEDVPDRLVSGGASLA